MVKSFIQDERGVSMIEYGLLAALIAVVCISTVTSLGTSLKSTFNTIAGGLSNANTLANQGTNA